MNPLLARYRRTGADLPFGDPRPSHLAEMEGYFWRFTDVAAGRVVVALCGVNDSPTGRWATVALASSPGGVRSAEVPLAEAATDRFSVRATGHDGVAVLEADADGVRVDLGPGARLDARLAARVDWPRPVGGAGLASMVPFLNQYWHPHLLGATVRGRVELDDGEHDLGRATVYAEKNWGAGFPPEWWWGQAHGFDRDDVCVAFTGGHLALGPLAISASGAVVRLGDEVVRLAPPLALVRCRAPSIEGPDGPAVDGRWVVDGRSARYRVRMEGHGGGARAHVLPVPLPAERRNVPWDFEHLAGHLDLEVRRGGRTIYEGTSHLAGLEVGSVNR